MGFFDSFKLVWSEHINGRKQIFQMALKDLKKQFSGTALGALWPVIKNMVFVFAYWFTMQIGMGRSDKGGFPYIVWLVVGLIPWFFIRDTLVPAASSIRKNKYLVTKMIFPVSTISTFKVISGFMSSFMFLGIGFLICFAYGVFPNIHWIQIIYYAVAALILMIGISYTTSALVVVSRDIEFFLNSIIVLIFWLSPILWPIGDKTGILAFVLKLNPFFYVVEGFRESMLYGKWFFESPMLTLYFWGVVIVLFVIGIFLHGKLRDHFADIL